MSIGTESVRRTGYATTVVRTSDADLPSVHLHGKDGKDLVRRLTRAGAPGAAPAPEPEQVRCLLCGRPESGAVRPAVHICDLCSGRTRLEALETGHGLSNKEQRPL